MKKLISLPPIIKYAIDGTRRRGILFQLIHIIIYCINKIRFYRWNSLRRRDQIVINKNIRFFTHPEAYVLFKYNFAGQVGTVQEMQSFIHLSAGKKCFIDCGAFYGIFSLVFTSVNPNGIAYAIEPDENNASMLERHLEINPQLDIRPFQIALGNADGKLKMHREWKHLVASNGTVQRSDNITVTVNSLDTFVATHNIVPDIIKIDTEGFEYFILEGASKSLKKYHPLLCIEVHPLVLKHYKISLTHLVNQIYSFGYKIFNVRRRLLKNPVEYLKKVNIHESKIICIYE